MAATLQTIKLNNELSIVITDMTNHATRELVKAWVRAWDEISTEFTKAIDDLLEVGDGEWPSRAQVLRTNRAQHALDIATGRLEGLSDMTGVLVVKDAGEAAGTTADWQARIIASQMPPAAGTRAELTARFDRVDGDVLDAMVERTTERITSYRRPMSREATEAMQREVIRGVTVGDNPRVAARAMLERVEGAFNGGLTRAMTIARTEIIDAHRSGAAAAHWANEDVLAGWQWICAMDKRTCPSCWSKHGNQYPLSETGPDDHQQGRCARMPVPKSWRELGFDIPEPPSAVPDAQKVFASMSKADQLAVMGPVRLHALNTGAVAWADLSVQRFTYGWRPSWAPRPVRQIRRQLLTPLP